MKGLFKRLSILTASLAMVFGVGLVNDEKSAKAEASVYKQTIFSADNNSAGNSSYTGTFDNTTDGFAVTVAKGNNNKNGWSGHVRFGQKGADSKGSIVTKAVIDKAITRIDITIGAKCTNVNAINAYADTNSTPTTLIGSFTGYGTNKTISLDVSAKTTTNLFYKIEFDMAKGANGNLDIGQVDFYVDDSIGADTPYIGINEGNQKIQPNESVTFTTTIKNVDSTPTVTWSTDTTDFGTIDQDGKFTATADGVATVTASMTIDGTEYTSSVKVTVKTKVAPIINEVTVTDLLAKTANDNTVVQVKGKVANMKSTSYGNFDLVDLNDSTKSIYVYGATADATKLTLTDSEDGYYTGTWQSGTNFNNACAEGDTITMNVIFLIYGSTKEIQGVITNVEKPTESITLSDTSAIIKNGASKTLTATLTGLTGSVTWASSNTDVAEISENGVITTKAAGNTTITATLGTVTATCYVGVTDNLGSAEEPFTVQDAIYAAIAGNGLNSTEKYYIKGIIASYTPSSSDVSSYGNISFDISDDGTTTKVFKAFQVYYKEGAKFTSTDQVAVGDTVVLYGQVVNYNNTTPETVGRGAAYVYEHTPKAVRTLESLSLSGTLTKTEYTTDDTFSADGLTITANYSDNTTEDVTNDVIWPALTVGMTSITGTYEDKTIEVTGITVTESATTYTLTIKLDVEAIYADTNGTLTYELKDSKGNAFSGNITTVAWSSSNTTVLDIEQDSGEYLAYEAGTTTIELWVYTNNTSIYFSAKLEIEVVDTPAHVLFIKEVTGIGEVTQENYNSDKVKKAIVDANDYYELIEDESYKELEDVKSAKATLDDIIEMSGAYAFVDDWNDLREVGDGYGVEPDGSMKEYTDGGSICGYLRGEDYALLKELLDQYNLMSEKQKTYIDAQKDGDTTIGNTISYIQAYLAIHGEPTSTGNQANQNNLTKFTSSNNVMFVLIICVLGLFSIGGYYFINKRRMLSK